MEQFLQIFFNIVKRILPDEIIHALGLLVQFLIQFILLRDQAVQLLRQRRALFGIGFGDLLVQFLRGFTESFLFFDQLLQIVIEFGVFGFRDREVVLFEQIIIVILNADDRQAEGQIGRASWRERRQI